MNGVNVRKEVERLALLVTVRVLLVHWGQKRSARSRFFKANFDGFWQFSQKVLKIQKLYIPHLKALIYSYYEPEGQGVWCLHMTARLL